MENTEQKVPVDPKNPEKPIKLITIAVSYLVEEMSRLNALASDAAGCKTAYAGGVLTRALADRIAVYNQRGLQALVAIVNNLVREYDRPQEPSDEKPAETAP